MCYNSLLPEILIHRSLRALGQPVTQKFRIRTERIAASNNFLRRKSNGWNKRIDNDSGYQRSIGALDIDLVIER